VRVCCIREIAIVKRYSVKRVKNLVKIARACYGDG
jgi:hypothetical protein